LSATTPCASNTAPTTKPSGIIPVQHDISKYLKKGERIFLRDGQIQIEIEKIENSASRGKVLAPGLLYSNQGMNLPDTDLGGDILTPKDIADIEFGVKQGTDYIGYSFVQTAQDIINLRARSKSSAATSASSPRSKPPPPSTTSKAIVAATDASWWLAVTWRSRPSPRPSRPSSAA
jgi:pyruvate kinase